MDLPVLSRSLIVICFFEKIYLAVLVFVAACGLSLVATSRGYCLVVVHGLRLQCLLLQSLPRLWDMQLKKKVVMAHGLSCPCCVCNLPGIRDRTGIPCIGSRFLTNGPPGRPSYLCSVACNCVTFERYTSLGPGAFLFPLFHREARQ